MRKVSTMSSASVLSTRRGVPIFIVGGHLGGMEAKVFSSPSTCHFNAPSPGVPEITQNYGQCPPPPPAPIAPRALYSVPGATELEIFGTEPHGDQKTLRNALVVKI